MYTAMAGRKLSSVRSKVWRVAIMRSGWLTALILAVLLGGLVLVVRERGRGHLSRLQAELRSKPQPQAASIPLPGGMEPVVLQRSATAGGTMPEFLSATILPGRGMNIFQITASLPTRGEVQLLASPSISDATARLSGNGSDANGLGSLELGGAFEIPWAGRMGGVPTPDGADVMAVWKGQTLMLPAAPKEIGKASFTLGGLMLKRGADKVETHAVSDGAQSRLFYNASGFDGHWLSQSEVTTIVQLNGSSMDIEVVVKNTGPIAEPIGVGWQPHFNIPSGDRDQTTLRVPSASRLEVRASGTGAGLPTGHILAVGGPETDFSKPAGTKLGARNLDETYVHLKRGVIDSAPMVELRDVAGKFGLRMTLLSTNIKAVRIQAPSDRPVVTIGPQFNYDDPFGKEWAKDEDTGMTILQPGQSVEWKVRLELFPLAIQGGPHF